MKRFSPDAGVGEVAKDCAVRWGAICGVERHRGALLEQRAWATTVAAVQSDNYHFPQNQTFGTANVAGVSVVF